MKERLEVLKKWNEDLDDGPEAGLLAWACTEIDRLRNKLNTDSQNLEIECLRAEVEMLRKKNQKLIDLFCEIEKGVEKIKNVRKHLLQQL
jgi:hypothetical protein